MRRGDLSPEARATLRVVAILEAIKPYLPLLEGKAGTGWCMHDRIGEDINPRVLWANLDAAIGHRV